MTEPDYRGTFEDATHRLDQFRDKLRQREAALRELETLSIEQSSPDRVVNVTVNSDGLMLALHLTSQAEGLSPSEISVAIMRTYGAAQQEAARRSADIVESVYGSDSPALQKFHRRQELDLTKHGDGTARTESPASPEHDDDDFNPSSLYRG